LWLPLEIFPQQNEANSNCDSIRAATQSITITMGVKPSKNSYNYPTRNPSKSTAAGTINPNAVVDNRLSRPLAAARLALQDSFDLPLPLLHIILDYCYIDTVRFAAGCDNNQALKLFTLAPVELGSAVKHYFHNYNTKQLSQRGFYMNGEDAEIVEEATEADEEYIDNLKTSSISATLKIQTLDIINDTRKILALPCNRVIILNGQRRIFVFDSENGNVTSSAIAPSITIAKINNLDSDPLYYNQFLSAADDRNHSTFTIELINAMTMNTILAITTEANTVHFDSILSVNPSQLITVTNFGRRVSLYNYDSVGIYTTDNSKFTQTPLHFNIARADSSNHCYNATLLKNPDLIILSATAPKNNDNSSSNSTNSDSSNKTIEIFDLVVGEIIASFTLKLPIQSLAVSEEFIIVGHQRHEEENHGWITLLHYKFSKKVINSSTISRNNTPQVSGIEIQTFCTIRPPAAFFAQNRLENIINPAQLAILPLNSGRMAALDEFGMVRIYDLESESINQPKQRRNSKEEGKSAPSSSSSEEAAPLECTILASYWLRDSDEVFDGCLNAGLLRYGDLVRIEVDEALNELTNAKSFCKIIDEYIQPV
jgi:hypothetical protein